MEITKSANTEQMTQPTIINFDAYNQYNILDD